MSPKVKIKSIETRLAIAANELTAAIAALGGDDDPLVAPLARAKAEVVEAVQIYDARLRKTREVEDLKAAYRLAMADARQSSGTPRSSTHVRDARLVVHKIVTMLGHTALFQGTSGECSLCGKSGAMHETDLVGELFTRECPATLRTLRERAAKATAANREAE